MNRPNLLLLILLSTAITIAGGQPLMAQEINENNFTLYTKEQGLSRNIITGLAQDSTGYLWISTTSGLNRFNGSDFIQFHSGDDSLSLPAENIEGMVWLDHYRLCTYGDGLHIIDTRSGEAHNLFIPYNNKQYQYKFNWIMSVNSDAAGDIFVLARSGFYHFDKDYRLVFRFDYYRQEEIPTTSFVFGRYLLSLDKKSLAIISSAGIFHYDIARRQFGKMVATDCPPMAEFLDYPNTDYQFFQQKPGCVFIMKSYADSVVYINIPENKKSIARLPFLRVVVDEFDYRSEVVNIGDTTVYITGKLSGFYKMTLSPGSGKITFYPKKYFSVYSCRHLLQDRNHTLWIATNKGLLRQNNNRVYIQQATIPESVQALFPNIVIDDICGLGDKLYVAARGDAGLLIFDKQRLQFIRKMSFEKYYRHPDNIFSIESVNGNSLLAGSNGPLFLINTATGRIKEIALEKFNRKNNWIADLCKDRDGNIWIASERIYKYDAVTGKSSLMSILPQSLGKIEQTQRIQQDTSGNMWMAGHGVLRYNITSNAFDRLVDSFPFIKIPDRQVNTFIADKQNNLWINSNNNGLICYNIDRKTFRHFTRDNGLPDNNMAAMIIIRNKLWIATFSGIACLDLQTFKITSFGKEDGFPDQPIAIGSNFFYDSTLNKLYIGYTNIIVRFDPDIISQKSQPPHLFIESVVTGDEKKFVFPRRNLPVSWRDNEITITIGSINFFTGSSQRFAYRLVKSDSTRWQQLGTQNTFSISNLSPGYHRIQVKLFSVSNKWPEQVRELNIIIAPPFWKQTWFTVISAIILLLCVYLFIRWRTGLIRKKEEEKTHIQKLKAEEYKNQFELEQISNYFSSSLAGIKNVEEVLWDVSKNLIGRMNYADCMIYLWNEDKTRMVQKASYGPKGNPVAITAKVFDVLPGQGVVGHVMLTKEPLIIKDTRKDKRYRIDDIMRLSEICVPIIHNNELMGIIDSEHPAENHFKERDIKILTTIATLISTKIKQIESERSLEIKQKEIAFINQQLAEAQLLALQTQMNPHFIFNSLNSIKGMILENEQQKASRYMSKFANMIRTTLNQSKEIFTTLYENMEHLENYLAMEKLRFDDSFTYRIIADDDLDKEETLLPTLMIQPLAENAIWHGLMPKKGRKRLSIHFTRQGKAISCTIEDNGIGLKRSEELKQLNRPLHQSVGLNNLRNRIKLMNEKYNAGCTLEITDLTDLNKNKTGCCAILNFNSIINKPYL